nr:PfkB family carbohydrate kinase [Mesorhizobium sp.]
MPRPIVLSLGSINADLQFDVQGSLGVGGTVRASGFAQRAGGKAANVAYFTHRLGVPTRLIGRIGDDHFAEIAVGPLKAAELDLGSVGVTRDVPTGVAIVAVPKHGTKAILSASNANKSWNDAAVDNVVAAIRNSPDRSILIADFEIPLPVLNAAFETAQEHGFRVLVDPTFADQIDRWSQLGCRRRVYRGDGRRLARRQVRLRRRLLGRRGFGDCRQEKRRAGILSINDGTPADDRVGRTLQRT